MMKVIQQNTKKDIIAIKHGFTNWVYITLVSIGGRKGEAEAPPDFESTTYIGFKFLLHFLVAESISPSLFDCLPLLLLVSQMLYEATYCNF